jgi:Type IV secretion-system coupling protein DNA-binding domain
MSLDQKAREEAFDPWTPVHQLVHWLADTATHAALALVIAAALARFMRARHLHWSWAAIACAALVLARAALAGWATALVLATLLAAVRGRRWHREDLDAGADLREIAEMRIRPSDVLRAGVRELGARVRTRLGAPHRLHGCALQVGVDEHGGAVSIPFAPAGGDGAHTLVVGATGSGKTVTQSWIAARSIEHGMAAVVVDPKGDEGLREHLRRAAAAAGRRFLEWTPEGALVYNPYARGSASEIADKALAGERFTEPHYLRQAQRYLGHAVRALQLTGAEVSLRALVDALDPRRLELLARELDEEHADAIFAYLDSLSARQQSELGGVRDRLAILAESDVGRWLAPQTPGVERFEMLDAVRRRSVVYFSLQSDSRPLLAEMLGAAIVQDLQSTVASLQAEPVPTLVAIDEFSALGAEQVVRLFGRARSAGLSLLLGTQELSDLRLPGRERVLDQILGNLSVLIAHRQVVPSSAELISSIAGSRGAWRLTRHSGGRTTSTRTREPVLDPGRVTSLARGWAAVLVLARGRSVRVTRMLAPGARR